MVKMATFELEDGGINEDEAVGPSNPVLCLLWVGTAGLGGHLLGTDEEEIVYLRYVLYNTVTKQIVHEKEYTIKPPPPSNHNNNSTGSNSSTTTDDSGHSQHHKERRFNITEHCYRDYKLTSDRINSEGENLLTVFQEMEDVLDNYTVDSYSTNSTADSTTLPPIGRPVLITDGQLHLRQVLQPKTAFHNIPMPSTYNAFHDLRKYFKTAYGPKDEMNSVQDMANYLEMDVTTDENLGIRSTALMVEIIARMIIDGHTFKRPERIDVKLEPGTVVRGEEVDNNCVVRARGLPWMSTDTEIAKFFRGLNLAKGGVALCLTPQGRRNGEALIRFTCPEHRDMALKRHKHHMGGRYIEVYKATGEDFISVATGNNNEASQFLARGSLILRMRGLPYDCTAKQVVDFFESGDEGVRLVENEDGVLFVRKPDGRATGDAFVMLASEEDVNVAMKKHKKSIGSRYIELFRSSSTEVMNRSMDLRHIEQPAQSIPLIAALPTTLLPQQSVAHGQRKDCVRLRGLPFEAQIEHVLEFLGEYAKSIRFRGVHMVYTPQGQPSGEAFIQMMSDQAALACATNRHNRFIQFGKKNRYIEVLQCSGDDMNLVLSGATPGSPQPQAVASRSLVAAPGGSPILSPYGTFPMGPAPPTIMGHTITPAPRIATYPPTIAAAPYPMYYWPYPSPPVSPTNTYYSSLTPHTIIPSECMPIHTAGDIPMHPGEAVATM